MGAPVTLLGALGDRWLFTQWADGRIVMETPAPVTLRERLALSVLLNTADKQAGIGADPSGLREKGQA